MSDADPRNLLDDLKKRSHFGPFAANILQTWGREIADLMPPEFFDALKQVYAAIQRPPLLLLLTYRWGTPRRSAAAVSSLPLTSIASQKPKLRRWPGGCWEPNSFPKNSKRR